MAAMRLGSVRSVFAASALLLVATAAFFNGQLLFGATWCDQRISRVTQEKDGQVKHAMDQLADALSKQADALQRLQQAQKERRRLRHQVADLRRGRTSILEPHAEAGFDLSNAASRSQPATQEPQGMRPVGANTSVNVQLAGSGTLDPASIAVVVIAYNRAEYLDRALTSICKHHPGGGHFEVFVSQDGENTKVQRVIEKHKVRQLVHPRKTLHLPPHSYLAKHPGYAYLAVHYGWALRTIFDLQREGSLTKTYEGVIILEEDIEASLPAKARE